MITVAFYRSRPSVALPAGVWFLRVSNDQGIACEMPITPAKAIELRSIGVVELPVGGCHG